ADEVIHTVRLAVSDPELKKAAGIIELTELSKLTPLERQVLVDKHLVSPQQIEEPAGRAVVLNADESLSIMINEEDHLRIQCLLPGLQLQEAWEQATKIDDLLEKTLDFSYCGRRGYLTACPTNVGTGLRASVMMHLPGLVMTNKIYQALQAISQLGLTARGFYGEGTEALGNLFQVSNQITLGLTEEEILKNILTVAKQLIAQERAAREMLFKEHRVYLEDRIGRAVGIMKFARVLTSEEALRMLSDVRLGVDLEIVKGIEKKKLNELLMLTTPAFMDKKSGREMTPQERDTGRAAIIREILDSLKVES
ncbi:protein arginine kinase, partial [bacterium]